MVDNKVIKIHRQWYPILGEEISLIEPYHYVKLSKIFPPPKLPASRKYETVIEVLPYIRQKVKMWGADVLRAENIKTLIEEEDDVSVSDEEFSDVESMDEDQDFRQNKNKLSRFDCIASLLASSECTVAQDIFRTLSQFPIAFPLVIPGLVDADTFKVMLPLLIGPVIKWETKPGTIIENHLFSDPFKMIVAVRIGANSPGKSTILNQLMTSDSMFSSSCEPRAEYGIPHMVSGSVEFTWLTQETCGVGLWNDVFENYYKEGAKEIVLLANLHGDASDYPNQIRLLKQFPSSFLVFLMPGYTDDQVDHFENIVGSNKVVYCWVNHKKKKYAIDTKLLMKDQTLKKVRLMFKEALDFTSSFHANRLRLRDTLHFAEGIELPESQLLIKFVEEKTCRHIKLKVMQLQRKQSYNGLQIWQDNVDLQGLIFLYIDILNLPLGKRMRALAHLEREVSRLSMIESSEARNKAVLKREELRKSSLVNRNQESEESIRREIAKIWAEVDNMSLGMEHFFRELGRIYSIFSVHYQWHDIVVKVPKLYAELLISGHTIELLDGDAGDISEAWFSAICNCICKKFPKLRIFVISILGLQSSGKSTLLNALFACRFAVSVGRCTRGLFMRLLFLEKNLSDQLGVDAFVLIDTEGLGAPEKMDDPESEKKDRILATFAMGVSNLTILNVLGESTRDLTEILQIAIVTMARLEKAEMAPDILMVQHVSERNVAKLSEPEEKFRIALQEALKVAEEQDIEMGIFNTKCLHILDERIKKGQLLKQFRPFKNGATAYAPPSEQYHEDVVNLYESILADCKNSRRKIEFSEWNSLIQGYWRAVSLENFAVHFKNIKEIYEFIDLGKRITKVKEAISRAFLKHEEKIMQEIRSKLQNWSPDDRSNENSRLRDECLKLIESGLEVVLNCDNNSNCEECKKANKERVELEEYLKEKDNEKSETETKQTIENYIKLNRQSVSDKLTRMLSAIIIRKGLSSESLEIINRHLEDIIRNMPSRGFPDHERKRKIEEIWNALRSNILSKDKATPVERLIDDEVEYYYNLLPNDLHNKYKNGIYPELSKCKAYKMISYNVFTSLSQYLEKKDVHDLQGKLDNLADLIFKDRTSQHFYPGIVNDLKKVIEMTIINFQKTRSFFYSDFKWNIHLYALLKFKPKMKKFQDDWEKENSPLGILDQKRDEYLKIIDTRLQYGHSLVSEGHIVGNYLLRVIHKKAMKAGNYERVRAVSDIAWMTNSDTVRLKYFEELAEQIQKGDKAAAIRHFSIPEYSIKNWFIHTVNSIKNGNPEQKFKETFNSEFERVLQEIRNCKNFEEIKVYVNKYMTEVDNVDYKLDLKHTLIKDGSIKLFQRTIEEELENKGNGRYPNPEPFQNPSDDKSIMKRLGCTEACHWCGALCWGSRDHHENSDSTKVHHTSHQPSGLSGTKDRYTRELRAMPCHKMTDDWYVWYHGKVDATTWGDAKARDFSDWKFEAHCNQIFNDLMCWFLEKLHHDLAAKWDCKPAPYNEMRDHGCLSLNYDSIISTIRTKF